LLNNEELIKEILEGSQAAMEILVKKHYKPVFAYVYRKTGDKNTAFDITQEVFIKMLKALTHYNGVGKFENWLYKIAFNSYLDYVRASKANGINKQMELDDQLPDKQANVWPLLEKKLARKRIQQALDSLPEDQREVVILKYYHDLRFKDIAEITNSKEPTVKTRMRRGLVRLRTLLEGDENGEEAENRF
jgi:RNA polymerase sigma factor (sigma-70 family)